VSKSPPPASATAPLETQEATATPRQVTLLSPLLWFLFFSFSACRTNSVLHAGVGGKLIPPAHFGSGPGGSWPSPVFWAGSGPEENISLFFGPRSAQSILGRNRPNNFGLSPAQSVGPDQPNPFNIIYYIYYILYYLYIYI